MNGYELHDHRCKADPRPSGGDFVNFLSPVISASEEIFSQQAVCMSILIRISAMLIRISTHNNPFIRPCIYTSCGFQCFTLSRRGSLNGDLPY
jgi:hypothetical protein